MVREERRGKGRGRAQGNLQTSKVILQRRNIHENVHKAGLGGLRVEAQAGQGTRGDMAQIGSEIEQGEI